MKTTKFTAGLMAFSLAISAAAAPVRAGDEDVAKALGGLLALFVIGKAIDNASKSDRSDTPQITINKDTRGNGRGHGYGYGHDRNRHASPFDIPEVCVVTLDGRGNRDNSIALKSCLDEKRRARAPLPRRCEVDVRSSRRTLDAYDVQCLERSGFQVAERRRR